MKSKPDHYGAMAVSIHWLNAILILALLGSGFRAADITDVVSKSEFLRFHALHAVPRVPAHGRIRAMIYELLKFAHLVGLGLISGGLIGVWMFDLRSRQLTDLPLFAEAVRNIAVFYDGVVVPGALLLLASGTWLIVSYHGGWGFLEIPWLAGMVVLFALEFIEGNTVTRLYFMRLRRLSKEALRQGYVTPELKRARATERVPTFTHFLDIPLLLVIVSLGAIRPNTWTQFIVGVAAALLVATLLTVMIPRLYPWIPKTNSQESR